MPTFRASIFARHRLMLCLVVTNILLVASSANGANFTLEQVMSSPFPSDLVAASHAPRVAWVFNSKGVRNIWVADAPNFAARQITHYDGDEGLPIASLRITPDGRRRVYVRGSEPTKPGALPIRRAACRLGSRRFGLVTWMQALRECLARWAAARK